jgi:hypothetical protein
MKLELIYPDEECYGCPQLGNQARLTIKQVLPLVNKLLEVANHGDYSSGIEAEGLDEGRVRIGQYLDELRKQVEELREQLK